MSETTTGPKRLRRSRTDRYVGGVCGGVAKYLNMDPTLVRVLTAVLTLVTGAPVILYVVALFFMPEEDVVPAAPVAQAGDPVWGAGGPPWAPAPGAEPQAPAASATPTPEPASTPVADPPRRDDDTA